MMPSRKASDKGASQLILFCAMVGMILLAAYRVFVLRPEIWFDEAFSWNISQFPMSYWVAVHPLFFLFSIPCFFFAGYLAVRAFDD